MKTRRMETVTNFQVSGCDVSFSFYNNL